MVWTVLVQLKGKARIAAVGIVLAAVLGVSVTNKTVVKRIQDTIEMKDLDRQSHYLDDRLAFWHVHWEMIKERPIVGHGVGLNTAYRTPYYEKMGLGYMGKKYEAHNQFIQVLANGGLIAFAIFVGWLGWTFFELPKYIGSPFARNVLRTTLVTFSLTALTQNAFQDSEVRMGLTLLLIFMWMNIDRENPRKAT